MAAIDFPNSPTLNEEFTANGRTWIWDGSVWNAKETTVVLLTADAPLTYDSETATVGIDQSGLYLEAIQINQAGIELNANQIVTSVNDKSANYTLVAGDANTFIRSTGSAITVTVPDVLANGESVNFIQAGAGQITFAGSAVTINSVDAKLKTNKQFSGATITKLGGAYYLVGDLGA
jgi:hypothetical protein